MQSTVPLSLSLTPDRKDFVRCTFVPKISRVLSSLVHGCRYESTYGFSSRAALLLVHVCIMLSLGSLCLHARYFGQGLSHTLRDSHRLQRERKGNSHLSWGWDLSSRHHLWPDSSSCRIVAVFCKCKNRNYFDIQSLYEKWSTALFSGSESSNSTSLDECHVLFRSCIMLIRINGVVKKYRSFLVPGMLKLFYIDEWCVHTFIHEITTKWPVCTSKKEE